MNDKDKSKIDRFGNIGFLIGTCIITLINLIAKKDLYDVFTIFFLYTGFKYMAEYKLEKSKAKLLYTLASFLIALGNLVTYVLIVFPK